MDSLTNRMTRRDCDDEYVLQLSPSDGSYHSNGFDGMENIASCSEIFIDLACYKANLNEGKSCTYEERCWYPDAGPEILKKLAPPFTRLAKKKMASGRSIDQVFSRSSSTLDVDFWTFQKPRALERNASTRPRKKVTEKKSFPFESDQEMKTASWNEVLIRGNDATGTASSDSRETPRRLSASLSSTSTVDSADFPQNKIQSKKIVLGRQEHSTAPTTRKTEKAKIEESANQKIGAEVLMKRSKLDSGVARNCFLKNGINSFSGAEVARPNIEEFRRCQLASKASRLDAEPKITRRKSADDFIDIIPALQPFSRASSPQYGVKTLQNRAPSEIFVLEEEANGGRSGISRTTNHDSKASETYKRRNGAAHTASKYTLEISTLRRMENKKLIRGHSDRANGQLSKSLSILDLGTQREARGRRKPEKLSDKTSDLAKSSSVEILRNGVTKTESEIEFSFSHRNKYSEGEAFLGRPVVAESLSSQTLGNMLSQDKNDTGEPSSIGDENFNDASFCRSDRVRRPTGRSGAAVLEPVRKKPCSTKNGHGLEKELQPILKMVKESRSDELGDTTEAASGISISSNKKDDASRFFPFARKTTDMESSRRRVKIIARESTSSKRRPELSSLRKDEGALEQEPSRRRILAKRNSACDGRVNTNDQADDMSTCQSEQRRVDTSDQADDLSVCQSERAQKSMRRGKTFATKRLSGSLADVQRLLSSRDESRRYPVGAKPDAKAPPPCPMDGSDLDPLSRIVLHDMWSDNPTDIRVALVALRSLFRTDGRKETHITTFTAAGGHSILVGVMRKWYADAELQADGCRALESAT